MIDLAQKTSLTDWFAFSFWVSGKKAEDTRDVQPPRSAALL